jgi:hypothetical protein
MALKDEGGGVLQEAVVVCCMVFPASACRHTISVKVLVLVNGAALLP